MRHSAEQSEVLAGATGTGVRPLIRTIPSRRRVLAALRHNEQRAQHRRHSDDALNNDDLPLASAAGAFAALATLDLAFILIADDGRALFASASAQRIAARLDCYTIHSNRVQLLEPRSQRAFEGFLGRPSSKPNAPPTVICVAGRTSRAIRYALFAEWLHQPLRGGEPVASLFVYDPQSTALISPELLMCLHGLTRSEAQLTAKLYAEPALQPAADACGISINTAKTHLKNVFAKCGVRSKAELLRLLALGPRSLCSVLPSSS